MRRRSLGTIPVVVSVEIMIATSVDDDLVATVARILPQLSLSPPPSAEHLRAIVDGPDTALFLARLDGRTVGVLTLACYKIPTGMRAWIEDVIVDDAASRQGIGEALSRAAIDEARSRGAKDVRLTSRPKREAANRLYRRIGFDVYETNVYKFDF
jgi:ribosomal protein S18 acetylase RimI-like enzyme